MLPFVTEEVWSWWHEGSIHRSPWPTADPIRAAATDGDPAVYAVAADVLGEIRRAKSEAKRPLRTEVSSATATDTQPRIDALQLAIQDVIDAGRVSDFNTAISDGGGPSVAVELAPESD